MTFRENRLINRWQDRPQEDTGGKQATAEKLSPSEEYKKGRYTLSDSTADEISAPEIEANEAKLAEYFHLTDKEYIEVRNSLRSPSGLQISSTLAKYRDYIETDLQLTENTTLNTDTHQKIIENIKKIIASQVRKLPKEIEKVKKDHGHEKNMQWIVNEEVGAVLAGIGESLLPSAKFYINMHDTRFQKEFEKAFYPDDPEARKWSPYRLQATELIANIQKTLVEGQYAPGEIPEGLIGNHSLLHSLFRVHEARDEKSFVEFNESSKSRAARENVQQTSLLNEKDQAIETKANLLMLACALIINLSPADVVVDFEDIFSSEDATLSWLQRTGLVSKEFKMKKQLWENLLSLGAAIPLVGAIPDAMQVISKFRKVAGVNMIKILQILKTEAETISKALGISIKKLEKVTAKLEAAQKEHMSEITNRIRDHYQRWRTRIPENEQKILDAEIDSQRFIDTEHYRNAALKPGIGQHADRIGTIYNWRDDAFGNFRRAADHLRDCAKKGVPLTAALIQKVHEMTMKGGVEGIPEEMIGKYREVRVRSDYQTTIVPDNTYQYAADKSALTPQSSIENLQNNPLFDHTETGGRAEVIGNTFVGIQYASPEKVPKLMEGLIDWYNTQKNIMDPISLAAEFQRRMVSIHPFANGNGRTSRLIMDYILQLHGLPPTSWLKSTEELTMSADEWTKTVKDGALSTTSNHIGGAQLLGRDYWITD